jgi:hypothetical protein
MSVTSIICTPQTDDEQNGRQGGDELRRSLAWNATENPEEKTVGKTPKSVMGQGQPGSAAFSPLPFSPSEPFGRIFPINFFLVRLRGISEFESRT